MSSGYSNAFAEERIISSGTLINIYPALTSYLTAMPVYGNPFLSLNFDMNNLGFSVTPLALNLSK